jgi:hypothetical protein
MATLSSLKLTAAQRPNQVSIVVQRRNKLLKRLWEQLELAKARQAGTQFQPVQFRTKVDIQTGERKQVEVYKKVRPWWFISDNGKFCLTVRFGPKVLELAKGKSAIEVGSERDLIPTIELLKAAVLDGELDSVIEAAANKLRDGFSR